MNKLALIILAGASIAVLSLGAPQEADAGKDCARKEFKTELVKDACKKGGQAEAKKAMREFMKKAKKASGDKITCTSCHTKSSGDYPLKKDALKTFANYKKAM
jgi:hypothetical protein